MVSAESIREGLSYIRTHREIRDVLLSGGDPLLLTNRELYRILADLRTMPHVEIIRIGTRVPCTLPQRITPQLARVLGSFKPLYINTHFNHPDEITEAAELACGRLVDAGIPLGCQTVLLRGVNDDTGVMKRLMQKLLTIRVRPYYLFLADPAKGTSHFWTPLDRGLEIMSALQGHTSGLGVPHFAVDLRSPVEWGPEVSGSSYGVCLKQIIGPDPNCQEFLHQCSDYPCLIIDPFQEYGLAAQGDTCIGQSIARQGRLGGDFIRMVKVGIDIKRLEAP